MDMEGKYFSLTFTYETLYHRCYQLSVMVASYVTSYWKGNAYFMRD